MAYDKPDLESKLIVFEDEGTPVAGAPHTILDVVGAGAVVTNAGGGRATLTVSGTGMGSELAICVAERTTNYALTTSFVDITLNTTPEESDSAAIEHDAVTDRIVVKETGNYLVGYSSNLNIANGASSADIDFEGQIRINDTTVIPGTFMTNGVHYSGTQTFGEEAGLTRGTLVSLTAMDFLTLQLRRQVDTPSTADAQNATLWVARLRGTTGATGATGAGSSIIVQKDDVTIGTVTDTLNLEGSGITSVVDEGSNKTTATIDRDVPTVDRYNGAGQALSGTYATLTNMTRSLGAGTYKIEFSGYFSFASFSDEVEVDIFNGGVAVANGTQRRETAGDNGLHGTLHTMDVITLGSTTTIDVRGIEITGAVVFEKGTMVITKY